MISDLEMCNGWGRGKCMCFNSNIFVNEIVIVFDSKGISSSSKIWVGVNSKG